MSEHTDWVAVYRSSLYAWMQAGDWLACSLDAPEDGGDPLPVPEEGSLTLITAWNPNSEERPREENEAANARLLRALVAAGLPWTPAFGASLPGVEPAWREDGFALFGLRAEEAARWGRDWGQRAVVFLDREGPALILCAEAKRIPCRAQRRPVPEDASQILAE